MLNPKAVSGGAAHSGSKAVSGGAARPEPKVLFCTAAGNFYGMGHLRRCISIIDEGRDAFSSFIYIHKGDKESLFRVKDLFEGYNFVENIDDAGEVDLIISDMRETNKREMKKLTLRAPVISMDDLAGGRDRSYISIYSLPDEGEVSGNFNGASYLVLSGGIINISPKPFHQKEGILVSFGGTDPNNLTGCITDILGSLGIRPKIIKGPLFRNALQEMNGEIFNNPANIHDLINDSRILITSFGITMYEAFKLRTPVILFNNSAYHFRLAGRTDAINLGYRGSISRESLKKKLFTTINNIKLLEESAGKNSSIVDGRGARRVVSIIKKSLKSGRKDCLFRHKRYKACMRNNGRTILQCTKCGDLFLFDIDKKISMYDGEDYFLSEYKKQYGKTYFEDKNNIVKLSSRRIRIVERFRGAGGRILDVGCALGFFLELAQKRGWKAEGIEISRFASDWGRKNLSLDIITGSFLDVNIDPESFDVITFFFAAEHIQNVEKAIEKAFEVLKKKGIIALALPNRGGISFRLDRRRYINQHPPDHYFDTSIRNLKKFLRKYGFKKKKICVTGIHPERFFGKLGVKRSSGILNSVYTVCAKIFKLGDTFEYYGVKA